MELFDGVQGIFGYPSIESARAAFHGDYAKDLRIAAETQLHLYQMQKIDQHFASMKSTRQQRLAARRAERRLARRIARNVKR